MRSEIVGNVRDLHSWAQRAGAATAYTAQPGRMSVTDRGLLRILASLELPVGEVCNFRRGRAFDEALRP
jgi:isochorismate hydrolase